MIDLWYYWRGAEVIGPVSGGELSALGVDGGILPSDTVWREGYEHGVPASRVKNLFPAAGAAVAVAAPTVVAEEAAKEPPPPLYPPAKAARKSRAVAGKGTIIMGQDGKSVRFKMKCTTCGHEDQSVRSKMITKGTMRMNFHCSKCRKVRPTEMNGVDG
jgi:hypothetical protein